jgi:hypothetical protein
MIDVHSVIKKLMLKGVKKEILIKGASKFTYVFFLCFLNDIRKLGDVQPFFVFFLYRWLEIPIKVLSVRTL